MNNPEQKLAVRAFGVTAWIAGVFCLLVCGVLLYRHFTATTNDPWKSPQLLALKARLGEEPKNEPLKEEIRKMDLQFRERYRHRLALDKSGGWLLLGGMLVLVLSAGKAIALQKTIPLPPAKKDAAERAMRFAARARWTVVAVGLISTAVLSLIAISISSALPLKAKPAEGNASASAPAPSAPSLAEFQTNWPRFRGWDGSGLSTQTNVPLAWDEKSGTGIAWKAPVPAPGHSSPIIWGDRVYISGGTAAKREVFCYDASNGSLVWRRAVENVPGSPAKVPELPEDTGYASPTLATDGRRVYVIFANGDLAALNFDGTIAWSKGFGTLKNMYGYAASLAIWQDKLIVQLDQGDATPAGSKLIAFDGASGRVLWETSRMVAASWASPIVVEAAGKTQIITLANPWVISYSLADGNELWRAQLLDGEVVPSPIFAGGFVIVVNPGSKLVALRPDGAGDVTKTGVAWSTEENVPDISSPVSNGELVFTVTSSGLALCFDVKDGKRVWMHDLQVPAQASPAVAGGRLFVIGEAGVGIAVEAGREFREISRSELKDKFLATPGFGSDRLYLRGETNLFCITNTPHAGH